MSRAICRAGRHLLSKVGTYTTWKGLKICHGCQAEAQARYCTRVVDQPRAAPIPDFCGRHLHRLIGKNLYLTRYGSYRCMACQNDPNFDGRERLLQAVAAGKKCRKGHTRTLENTRVMRTGLACRICLRAWVAQRRADGEYARLKCSEPGCKFKANTTKVRPNWFCPAHRERDTSVIGKARASLSNAI